MDISQVVNYLGANWKRTGELIESALGSDIQLLDRTNGALLENGGKKLRPMILLLIAGACRLQPVGENSCRYAAATELLHNATLLHDDVADGSSMRRGSPTVSSQLGPTASVLIGDFWLAKAIEIVLGGNINDTEVISIFAKTMCDLAEGEMLQLQKAESSDTSVDDYFRIIYSKTASLFETSCCTAAISVGAPEEMKAAARNYGRNLGMAFQIRDDILDYISDDALGKPVGIDLKEKKITMPLLGALSQVDPDRSATVRKAVSEVDRYPDNIRMIQEFVADNSGIRKAEETLASFVDKAKKSLDAFPQSRDKQFLMELADYTGSRNI